MVKGANIPPIPTSQVKVIEDHSICSEVCDEQNGSKKDRYCADHMEIIRIFFVLLLKWNNRCLGKYNCFFCH